MSSTDFSRMSEVLTAFLEAEAEQLARATGFVERTSKMSGSRFAQTVILGWLANPDAPLNELVQWSARLGVDISEAGLQQRLNEPAVHFLAGLLERSLQFVQSRSIAAAQILSRFESVYVLDSSLITLPSYLSNLFAGNGRQGCSAALKVQLSYEYRRGRLNAVEVEAGRSPDQNCDLVMAYAEPNSLHVFDLGYFKVSTFEALDQAAAYFTARLQLQTALYAQPDDAQALDVLSLLAAQAQPCGELSVYMGRSARLPIRLIFQKLPLPVLETRRRKAIANARKRGETLSARHLALLEYALFITNIPADWLSPDQLIQLYRLRWHIELIFKLWKSQAHLDHIQPYRPERIFCQFFARLLGLVLFHALIAPWRFAAGLELSLPKACRILQSYVLSLVLALSADAPAQLTAVLVCMTNDFLRFAPTNSRHMHPSTFRRLLNLGLA